jgi:hypothetical protein
MCLFSNPMACAAAAIGRVGLRLAALQSRAGLNISLEAVQSYCPPAPSLDFNGGSVIGCRFRWPMSPPEAPSDIQSGEGRS